VRHLVPLRGSRCTHLLLASAATASSLHARRDLQAQAAGRAGRAGQGLATGDRQLETGDVIAGPPGHEIVAV